MLKRNFDVPPLIRLLQASVLIAFATGMMALVIATDNGSPRIAIDVAGSNVSVAP